MNIARLLRQLLASKYRYVAIAVSGTLLLAATTVVTLLVVSDGSPQPPWWIYAILVVVGGILIALLQWRDDVWKRRQSL